MNTTELTKDQRHVMHKVAADAAYGNPYTCSLKEIPTVNELVKLGFVCAHGVSANGRVTMELTVEGFEAL